MPGFETIVMEWGGALARWLHVIAGMAWIGSSFFFMHLDATLRPAPGIAPGAGGAAWQVHGGGFYEMRKHLVAPERMPEELTWHKWQSYWTWISGFFLLCWIYYAQSQLYLIDPSVMALTPPAAAALGVGALALGWLIYDGLCRSPLGANEAALSATLFVVVVAAAWGFAQVFSPRGALIHVGALMATWMTGNVAMVIIPNQRKVVAALLAGETPDARYGKQAKQRSTHNNYVTLPVVFLMLSNHAPLTYATSAAIPALVGLILAAGAVIRHFYNVRHADHARSPWWAWGLAALCVAAAIWLTARSAPGWRAQAPTTTGAPVPIEVQAAIMSRCSMCHAAEPVWDGIGVAPKSVRLDSEADIARWRDAIRLHAVLTHAMPPNNLTGMTREERAQVAAWLDGPAGGARPR